MSLNTCLADLEAQAVLEVLVLNLLMKTFLKQSVTQFEEYYKKTEVVLNKPYKIT